jgi:uncharacterized protein
MIKIFIFLYLFYVLFEKIYSVLQKRKEYLKKDTIHMFNVQLADNKFKRKHGLMYIKKKLKPNQGMLFDYKKNLYPSLWMKNTYIGLDAIFLDTNSKVIDLIENMKPLSKKSHKSNKLTRYILEVNKNTIRNKNIKLGDYIGTTLVKKNITNFKSSNIN